MAFALLSLWRLQAAFCPAFIVLLLCHHCLPPLPLVYGIGLWQNNLLKELCNWAPNPFRAGFFQSLILTRYLCSRRQLLVTSPALLFFFLMRPQLLNCLHALLRKLSHLGGKVIQEKHYLYAPLQGPALPLPLNSRLPPWDQHLRRSPGGRTPLCSPASQTHALWDALLRCLWALGFYMVQKPSE